MDNRPEIRQAQLKEQQAECDRRLAKAEYIPDLSFSVRYLGFNNFEVMPSKRGDRGSVPVMGAVRLGTSSATRWPRRPGGRAGPQRSAADAVAGRNRSGDEVPQVEEAALLVPAARTEYEAALEQLRVTTNRYREEAALLKDLLQAQARTTEAEFQYQQALSSYWGAMADLRRAMGDE